MKRKPNIDFQKKRPEATEEKYSDIPMQVDDEVLEGRKMLYLTTKKATDEERIIVETDEENPVTICEYTNGEFIIADGYRVRIKPSTRYDPYTDSFMY